MGCGKKCFYIALVVAVLAWILKVYPWQWWTREYSLVPPVSYDGRILFDLENLMMPSSEDEIVTIVKKAYNENGRIRVVADGHSWSKIAQTQDIMISLANYTGVDFENQKPNEVTVNAGTSLRSVSLELDKKNLAMIQLGSVAGQSIAGAISTGTHGTGLTIGNMASLVTKLRFISGTGQIVELAKGDERFEAAQVNIGLFGVLSKVTIKVKPKFNLKENRTHHSLDWCIENLSKYANDPDYTYVKFWVEFHNNFCVLFQTEETTDDVMGTPTRFMSFLTYYTFAVVTKITYILPSTTGSLMFLVDWIGFGKNTLRVDNSYLILNDYFELPVHQEGEILVDFNDCVEAVKTVRDVVIGQNVPVNYITEVRFIAGDEIWLSPSYDRPSGVCAITLTIYAPPETVERYFKAVYAASKKLNARFHWGKHFYAKRAELESLYPMMPDFEELRLKYDPKSIFINNFIRDTFQFKEEE